MNNPQLTRKLNTIDFSNNNYNDILRHVRTHDAADANNVWFPPAVNTERKRETYFNKFVQFVDNNGVLFYRQGNVNLQAVRPLQRDNILSQHWNDRQTMFGSGILLFYRFISTRYIGITRKYTIQFLRNQQTYQLYTKKRPIKVPVKIFNNPLEMFYVDLIEMNYANQNNYRYIFTCIDAASRLIYLRALTNKNDAHVALLHIINNDLPAGMQPGNVMSDQGLEFRGEFTALLNRLNITQKFTQSHSPLVVVESGNRRVRKQLSKLHAFNANNQWVQHLQEIQSNLNTKTAVTLEKTLRNQQKKQDELQQHLAYRHGDNVRVHLSQFYNDFRARQKDGTGKLNHVQFSVVYFTISEVIHPRHLNALPLYKINYNNGQPVLDDENRVRVFKHKDLRVINVRQTQGIRVNTVRQAEQINGIQLPRARGRPRNNVNNVNNANNNNAN